MLAAFETLASQGIHARVVSMPPWELFEQQSEEYRNSVLLPSVLARVAVEQAVGAGMGERRWQLGCNPGDEDLRRFGTLKVLQEEFGFTVEHVVAAARAQIEERHLS